MSAGELRCTVEDGVCTLTLDRPDKLNAVTSLPPFYPWWTDPPFAP